MPLAIDLFCGLGGWTEGLLAEGYDVVGFDIEHHEYGDEKYPAQLVLQDVLTLHGKQFKDVDLIVASPPCQAYSYRAMPWKRAKALPPPDNSLFDACFRIQREACEAAGRHVPLVVENVRGAQKWVGRARWNFGSFYLWGDVPALMPIASARKVSGFRFDGSGKSFQSASVEHTGVKCIMDDIKNGQRRNVEGIYVDGAVKNTGGSWFNKAKGFNTTAAQRYRAEQEGVKCGGDWFDDNERSEMRKHSSKSLARKAASAMIAKIPFVLSSHIARTYKPRAIAA